MAHPRRAQLLNLLSDRRFRSDERLAKDLGVPLFDVRFHLWRMFEDGLVEHYRDEGGVTLWSLKKGAHQRHEELETDRRFVDDGFGSTWARCSLGAACGLHVVRPGKADCNHPRCPE